MAFCAPPPLESQVVKLGSSAAIRITLGDHGRGVYMLCA